MILKKNLKKKKKMERDKGLVGGKTHAKDIKAKKQELGMPKNSFLKEDRLHYIKDFQNLDSKIYQIKITQHQYHQKY